MTQRSTRSVWGAGIAGAAAGAILVSTVAIGSSAIGAADSIADTGGATRETSGDVAAVLSNANKSHARNVILLIGDGMGDSEITAARNYAEGAAGEFAGIDKLPMTGQYTTYSVKRGTDTPDYVPDSAATGTAWATGTKTYDNAIGVDSYGEPVKSLLEIAKDNGLKTGNVTTSELQDATPAVQVAHVSQRSCYAPESMNADCTGAPTAALGSITEQLLATRPDVTLGGGATYFTQTATSGEYSGKTLMVQAEERGYTIVDSADELAAIDTADQDEPLLGLFAPKNLPTRYQATVPTQGTVGDAQECVANPARPASQPSLAAMTDKAIELLENDNGFFLQVEGASIDKQDHSADACGQIGETVDLDEAVQVALEFAKADGNTLVIVTADHAHTSQIVDSATPGLNTKLRTVDGADMIVAYGTAAAGGSQQHTGSQLRIAAYGPDSVRVVGLTDQTDTFFTIVDALGVSRTTEAGTTASATTVKQSGSTITVSVTARNLPASGTVRLKGKNSKGATVTVARALGADGTVKVSTSWLKKGSQTLVVSYAGSGTVRSSYTKAAVTVR